ncbi:titin homolog [Anabrus simplex]|uniref:titin homolog n=1 Tax=Anabrus simplex TaxID=316456 RepID=UPI0035A2D2E8
MSKRKTVENSGVEMPSIKSNKSTIHRSCSELHDRGNDSVEGSRKRRSKKHLGESQSPGKEFQSINNAAGGNSVRISRKSAKKACLWLQEACKDISKVSEFTSSQSHNLCTKEINIINMTDLKKVTEFVSEIRFLIKCSTKNLLLVSKNLKSTYDAWLRKQLNRATTEDQKMMVEDSKPEMKRIESIREESIAVKQEKGRSSVASCVNMETMNGSVDVEVTSKTKTSKAYKKEVNSSGNSESMAGPVGKTNVEDCSKCDTVLPNCKCYQMEVDDETVQTVEHDIACNHHELQTKSKDTAEKILRSSNVLSNDRAGEMLESDDVLSKDKAGKILGSGDVLSKDKAGKILESDDVLPRDGAGKVSQSGGVLSGDRAGEILESCDGVSRDRIENNFESGDLSKDSIEEKFESDDVLSKDRVERKLEKTDVLSKDEANKKLESGDVLSKDDAGKIVGSGDVQSKEKSGKKSESSDVSKDKVGKKLKSSDILSKDKLCKKLKSSDVLSKGRAGKRLESGNDLSRDKAKKKLRRVIVLSKDKREKKLGSDDVPCKERVEQKLECGDVLSKDKAGKILESSNVLPQDQLGNILESGNVLSKDQLGDILESGNVLSDDKAGKMSEGGDIPSKDDAGKILGSGDVLSKDEAWKMSEGDDVPSKDDPGKILGSGDVLSKDKAGKMLEGGDVPFKDDAGKILESSGNLFEKQDNQDDVIKATNKYRVKKNKNCPFIEQNTEHSLADKGQYESCMMANASQGDVGIKGTIDSIDDTETGKLKVSLKDKVMDGEIGWCRSVEVMGSVQDCVNSDAETVKFNVSPKDSRSESVKFVNDAKIEKELQEKSFQDAQVLEDKKPYTNSLSHSDGFPKEEGKNCPCVEQNTEHSLADEGEVIVEHGSDIMTSASQGDVGNKGTIDSVDDTEIAKLKVSLKDKSIDSETDWCKSVAAMSSVQDCGDSDAETVKFDVSLKCSRSDSDMFFKDAKIEKELQEKSFQVAQVLEDKKPYTNSLPHSDVCPEKGKPNIDPPLSTIGGCDAIKNDPKRVSAEYIEDALTARVALLEDSSDELSESSVIFSGKKRWRVKSTAEERKKGDNFFQKIKRRRMDNTNDNSTLDDTGKMLKCGGDLCEKLDNQGDVIKIMNKYRVEENSYFIEQNNEGRGEVIVEHESGIMTSASQGDVEIKGTIDSIDDTKAGKLNVSLKDFESSGDDAVEKSAELVVSECKETCRDSYEDEKLHSVYAVLVEKVGGGDGVKKSFPEKNVTSREISKDSGNSDVERTKEEECGAGDAPGNKLETGCDGRLLTLRTVEQEPVRKSELNSDIECQKRQTTSGTNVQISESNTQSLVLNYHITNEFGNCLAQCPVGKYSDRDRDLEMSYKELSDKILTFREKLAKN